MTQGYNANVGTNNIVCSAQPVNGVAMNGHVQYPLIQGYDTTAGTP